MPVFEAELKYSSHCQWDKVQAFWADKHGVWFSRRQQEGL